MKLVFKGMIALFILCFGIVMLGIGVVKAFPPSDNSGRLLYVRPYELGHCLNPLSSIKEGIVIQDQEALNAQLRESPDCQADQSTKIDFIETTLLGAKFFIPGGCSRGGNAFTVSVERDDRHRVYTHTVVTGTGPCAGNSDHQIWLLVPKLPAGYRVEFHQSRQPGLLITCGYEEF